MLSFSLVKKQSPPLKKGADGRSPAGDFFLSSRSEKCQKKILPNPPFPKEGTGSRLDWCSYLFFQSQ